MILLVPVVFLAAISMVVFLVLQCIGIVLPGNRHWSGWRRWTVAGALACAATATASYSLGAINLMLTVSTAQDGGTNSAPLPYNHPCMSQLKGATDYDVQFLTLRTLCVMEDGERIAVDDVPQGVRVTAAAAAGGSAVLAGIAAASGAFHTRPTAGRRP
ncbi:hypothetical protein C6Y14_22070 [Streptomyces dioscori]|uniref:Uncharacterized protein n=1 Tax=Streptomyces dioscori TaxID=2109333 RepID=A0A2P8Q5D0_9ACTN|nr:hypothetical protein [Streptomyces dioscori]PSM41450.1 hypothetical protein C6Y14_22070 [Streptomyces dioscori]